MWVQPSMGTWDYETMGEWELGNLIGCGIEHACAYCALHTSHATTNQYHGQTVEQPRSSNACIDLGIIII